MVYVYENLKTFFHKRRTFINLFADGTRFYEAVHIMLTMK